MIPNGPCERTMDVSKETSLEQRWAHARIPNGPYERTMDVSSETPIAWICSNRVLLYYSLDAQTTFTHSKIDVQTTFTHSKLSP